MRTRVFLIVIIAWIMSTSVVEAQTRRSQTDLTANCQKLLKMQVAVLKGTERLCNEIERSSDKKPRLRDKRAMRRLASKEQKLINLANKVIQGLEEDGGGVAFPEVFRQVRGDMEFVQSRLRKGEVCLFAQYVQKDIVETLQEMIDALGKRH